MTDTKVKNDKLVDNTIPRDDAIPEEAPTGTKEVKRRRRLSPDETRILAEIFEQTQKPNAALRSRLAQQLDMSSRAVQIWFQNRRAKLKRDASEAQNSYIFDRNRRLSLHLYDRGDNNYYMPPDGMDSVARRASYSVGYPQMNQNYQPMMNGSNQYAPTGQMNQYSQNNGYPATNSLQPQANNMTYQNQNVYMGQQQVVQPIQEQQIQQPIPNEQIMVNNGNNANYNNQNQQQMYIQYQQGPSQIISKQNNGQQIQQIVNPMNYSNNNMSPPSQTQNNQILQQTQNNNQVMGIQQIGIVDQQQTQQNQQQSNNYPLTTAADNSSTTIVQQSNNNGLAVTSSGSNIYNQAQQQMSGQMQNFSPRNLPSPPLNNNKQMNSAQYNYVNNNTAQNNNQQQNNNSPYMNQNNQQYQQGMINNQQQNIYTGNEPLSPVTKDNNNAAAGNSTPLNWTTTNVVSNDQGININMNTNVSTPSYNNSASNQINNNNTTTPNFNNNQNYYLYQNQKQMNSGVVSSSYISPVES